MKTMMISLIALLSINSYAMTCTKDGITLKYEDDIVTVGRAGSEVSRVAHQVVWDGHATGIVTGRGFSLAYANHYGCFRMVRYTGPVSDSRQNILSIDFGDCDGGSTPDSLCNRN